MPDPNRDAGMTSANRALVTERLQRVFAYNPDALSAADDIDLVSWLVTEENAANAAMALADRHRADVMAQHVARRDANARGLRPVISQDAAYTMLAALEAALDVLDNMTSEDFSLGKDKPARTAIRAAIRAAIARAEGSK